MKKMCVAIVLIFPLLVACTSYDDDEPTLEPVPYQLLDTILFKRTITFNQAKEFLIESYKLDEDFLNEYTTGISAFGILTKNYEYAIFPNILWSMSGQCHIVKQIDSLSEITWFSI